MQRFATYLDLVEEGKIADKETMKHARELAAEFAASVDPAHADSLLKVIHGAYLNLQMALVSDDPEMIESCREDCRSIIREAEQMAAREGKKSATL